MKKLIRALGLLITIYALTVSISAQTTVASSEKVIGQARGAYYNLTRQGFHGFEAGLDPKWEVILGPTATEENLKVFRAVRFSITVDARGAVTLSHVVVSADKTRLEPYIKQIDYNIKRLVTGLFGTWAAFMVNSPFPENESQIKVEDSAAGCRLFYTTQSADVVLTLTNDLAISEWKLIDRAAKRTVRPLFQKTTDGLLLTGYHSLFEPLGVGIKTTLDINIDYQVVNGMKLPRKIRFKGMHGSEPVEAELTLHSVRAARRS